jgi:DNA-binding winged helix-turn-helix (wHTH) protein
VGERIAEAGGWDEPGRLDAAALFRLAGGNYAVVRVRGRKGSWPLPSSPADGTEVYVDHTPQLALWRASRRGRDGRLKKLRWRIHEWVVRTQVLRRLAAAGRRSERATARTRTVPQERKGDMLVSHLRALPSHGEGEPCRGLLDPGTGRGPDQRCCERCPEPLLSGQLFKWCVRCLERLVLDAERQGRSGTGPSVLRNGPLGVDVERRRVYVHGREVRLTPTEYAIVEQLMRNPGKVLAHRTLLVAVWGPEHGDASEYLRVYVGRLRRKLDAGLDGPALIATEHGVGYRLVEHPAPRTVEAA